MSVLALIEAVKTGDSTTVQTLLNSHIDIEQNDEYGWTALLWAAGQGQTAIVQLLLNAGANVARSGRDNRTAYQIAIAATHVLQLVVPRTRFWAVQGAAPRGPHRLELP